MKIRNQRAPTKMEIPLTPMVDIVFQLLVFFVMTFKIVAPEGDFTIRMPKAAPSEGPPDPNLVPPIAVRLLANDSGGLAGIRVGQVDVNGISGLRNEVARTVGDAGEATKSDFEVELDADYNLQYVYTMEALTAVSGTRNQETREIERLVEKIKFKPPRKPSE